MKKISSFIIKYRIALIIIIALITVFFAYQLKYIKINSDFVKSLPEDNPIASEYKNIGKKYKGIDMGMIILEADNIYTTKVIEDVKRITDTLRTISGINTVTSLTNIINIKSDSNGIEIGKLLDEYNLPKSNADFDLLRQKINEKDMYKGAIVTNDGKATIIMFTLFGDVNQQEVAQIIKNKIQSMNLNEKIMYGGMPLMMLDISELIIKDVIWLIPLITIILVLILFFSFKSFKGTVLPLLTVAISSIWTIGTMALLKYDLTMIGGVIPVILFAVGSAYAIHVVNYSREVYDKNLKNGLVKMLTYLILPVFLSSLTTVFGFLSFIFGSYLTMIKDFGLFSALGTFFSFILAITFIPALLSFFPNKKNQNVNNENKESKISSILLKPLTKLLFRHPKYILIIWLIILIFGSSSTFFMIRNTNIAEYFKKDNPTRISENILQNKFGGSSPIYIVFKGDMQSPEVLQAMIDMETHLKKNPYVSTTTSVANLIEELNDAMGEGVRIPTERAKIEQLWFLIEGQDVMSQLVSEDLKEGIIQSRFASVKSNDTKEFIQSVNKYIETHKNPNYQISLNGMPSIYNQMDKSLLNSQLSSLALAIILVFFLIGFSLKSFKLGLYGIIPILATIIMLFGFMGITGIPLDIATVLVASVAMGIGIDYSIHIITSYNFHIKETNDVKQAIEKTILLSGKAIVINVFSVAAGFLVLLFSQIVPIQYFGLLVAISMFGSGFGALTLLPVIIIVSYNKKNKKKSII